MKVCIDAGHGGNENTNTSPDKTYYEHEFTLDMAKTGTRYSDALCGRCYDPGGRYFGVAGAAGRHSKRRESGHIRIHTQQRGERRDMERRTRPVHLHLRQGGKRDELASKLLGEFEAGGCKAFRIRDSITQSSRFWQIPSCPPC
jgi:hypothetical protein